MMAKCEVSGSVAKKLVAIRLACQKARRQAFVGARGVRLAVKRIPPAPSHERVCASKKDGGGGPAAACMQDASSCIKRDPQAFCDSFSVCVRVISVSERSQRQQSELHTEREWNRWRATVERETNSSHTQKRHS